MPDETFPLRAITDRRYYHPKNATAGTGSVELTLECGHKIRKKRSAEPRRFARCEDCFYDQRRG